MSGEDSVDVFVCLALIGVDSWAISVSDLIHERDNCMRTLLDMLPTTVQSTVCARVWPEVALKRLAEVIETLPDADARLLLLRNLPQKPLCSRIQLILAKGACDFANESFPFLLKCAYPRNTERLDVDHDLAAAKAVATRVFRMDVMRFKRFAKGAIRPRASDCEAAQDLTRFLGVCDLVFTCSNMPYDLESARKIQALANVVNIFGIPYENGTEVKFACLNIPVRLIHFRLATYLFLCLPFRYGSLSISSSTTSGKNIHA